MALEILSGGVSFGWGLLNFMSLVLFLAALLGFFSLVGWFLYKYFIEYKVQATIFERIGGTWHKTTDRLKEIKNKDDKSPSMMKFFWRSEVINPIDRKSYGLVKNRPAVILHKFGDDYVPGTVTFNSPMNIDLPSEIMKRHIFIQQNKMIRKHFDFSSFLQKHFQVIVQIGGLVIIGFIIIITLKMSSDMVGQSAGMMDSIADKLASVVKSRPPG